MRSKAPRAIASTTPRPSTSASWTKRRRSSRCSETPAGAEPDKSTVSAVIRFLGHLRPELRGQLTTIEAKDANSLQAELDTGDDHATVVLGDSSNASLKVRTAAQLAAEGRTEIDVSVPSVPVTN